MHAGIAASLMFMALGVVPCSTPVWADSSVKEMRDTENLPTSTAKKDPMVSCVEPHCVHQPDGKVNAPASSQADRDAQGNSK